MRVYKRKGGKSYWIEFEHKKVNVRESARTTNRAEAKAYLDKRYAEVVLKLSPPKRGRLMFEDLCQLVRDDYEMNGHRSVERLNASIKILGQFFSGWLASEISVDAIELFKSKRLKAGRARATVNRDLAVLARGFRLAERRELISRKPVIVNLAIGDNARKGFVDKGQFYSIHARLPEWMRGPTEFMFYLGWRFGAVRQLERRDYDLATHTLTMRSEIAKNKEAIRIELPPSRLCEVIEEALAKARPDCPYLFHRDGNPLTRAYPRKVWTEATAAAGLGGILMHDLRRSAVKYTRKAGIPEQVAMRISGHKTMGHFRRYGIVDNEEVTEALIRIDTFVKAEKDEKVVLPMRGRRRGR